MQQTNQIKEKIIEFLKRKGPSLPVYIAKEINTSILFTSAFLSELLSEKRITLSNMKVGNSPIYYIKGQENLLENYSNYLKNKEKEAFLLLKEKKFLKDSEQEPAIRIALREIKDFAIQFRLQNSQELIWKYYTTPIKGYLAKEESVKKDVAKEESVKKDVAKEESVKKDVAKEESVKKDVAKEESVKKDVAKEEILDRKPLKEKISKIKIKNNKKNSRKKENQFFNKVKEHLSKNLIEILDIENFNKNDLCLIVKKDNQEEMIIAFNKRRITEDDIIKANKKAEEKRLKYTLLSLGEPLKKLTNFIDAIKNLSSLEKIE
jgi:hypothetical protein